MKNPFYNLCPSDEGRELCHFLQYCVDVEISEIHWLVKEIFIFLKHWIDFQWIMTAYEADDSGSGWEPDSELNEVIETVSERGGTNAMLVVKMHAFSF